MAKKPSAKQLAARRKFAKIMKSGGFKKRTRKAPRKTRKVQARRVKRVIRKVTKRVPMARRRRATRRSPAKKGFLKGLPIISNPTFKKAAAGIGTATLAVSLLSLVAPSIASQPLVKPVLALAGGDFIGLGAQLFTGGGLGSIFGGGQSMGDLA